MKLAKAYLGVLIGSLCVTASSAQTASTCAPIPDEKIGYQLYNLAQILQPPQAAPTQAGSVPVQPALPPANVAAAGNNAAQGRGARRAPPPPTPPELFDTNMAAMHKIGFKNMERFSDTLGESLEQYKSIVQKNGQNVIGGHGSLDMAQWDKIMADAKALGQTYIGSAGFGDPGFDTLPHTLETAANLDKLGKAALDKGLHLYVHNHSREIQTKYSYDLNKDGKPVMASAWEIVAANTDPRYVNFELDVHWARVAFGVDKFDQLLAFLRKYQNRIVMLHVKDTTADGKITDLGRGTTDWPAVFTAAGPGIRYYIWEYDRVPDVFKSGDIAYRFLRCQKQ